MNTTNYYSVAAKCGHVGRNNYIVKTFAVYAENGKEAAKIARKFPRVKHNQKDAILSVQKISKQEYRNLYKQNNSDLYFRCESIQDQKRLCSLTNQIKREQFTNDYDDVEEDRSYKHKLNEIISRSFEREIRDYCC